MEHGEVRVISVPLIRTEGRTSMVAKAGLASQLLLICIVVGGSIALASAEYLERTRECRC